MNTPQLKREPNEAERAILACAKAIDAMGETLREVMRATDRTLAIVQAMSARDSWVDAYRADDRTPFTELEPTHARARHYIEPDEGRE